MIKFYRPCSYIYTYLVLCSGMRTIAPSVQTLHLPKQQVVDPVTHFDPPPSPLRSHVSRRKDPPRPAPQNETPGGVSVGEVCKKCGKHFEDVVRLRAQKKCHKRSGQYQCRFCRKQFGSIGKLKRHERSHAGQKRYQCETCDRSFTRRENLTSHEIRIHDM